MGTDTKIEWCEHTFNPWIGCTKVSPGCDHCYAETLATQRLGVAWGPHAARRFAAESTWKLPHRWNRAAAKTGQRARVFCASLADVFDNQADAAWLLVLMETIRTTPNLDWLLLTKRPQQIVARLRAACTDADKPTLSRWDTQPAKAWIEAWLAGSAPPNLWLGTTAENQAEADRRIPHLLVVPAARRFLSCEPLLGPVDLRFLQPGDPPVEIDALAGTHGVLRPHGGRNARIDWVISGGESGPGARPSHPAWHRSLRDQCAAAGVPYFFKQWGEWSSAGSHPEGTPICLVAEDGRGTIQTSAWATTDGAGETSWMAMRRHGKQAAGALLDGREHREVPA